MGLSKSIHRGICVRSVTGLCRLTALFAFLLMLLFCVLQHQYSTSDPSLYNEIDRKLQIEVSQRRKQQLHRRVKHKPKTISKLAQAVGRNQHINDLRTSWGNDNLLLRQQQQNHHSISIGKNNDIFPIASTLQDTNNEYRYNDLTTRHRRHHTSKGGSDHENGKGHGKGKGKGGKGKAKGKDKGKGVSKLNCSGEGGSSKSKSKSKSGKGKGSSKSKYGSGKGKGKRRMKEKGGDGEGKVGKGKGVDKGEEKGGKGKGGGKGGKGKGSDTYYDDDDYGVDECYEGIIRPPFSLNNIAPIIAPTPTIPAPTPTPTSEPIIVAVPITITTTPIATTTAPIVVPPTSAPMNPPAAVGTNAPSGTSMTTTGPTPERGLVSVRVSDWYIAFRAPDAITRAPTREEYELVLEGTRVYLEMYFQNYFLTNMLNNVIYVRTDSLLGNAAYGLDVPTYVPQPSMIDDGRVNIYVQFRYVEFFYVDTSTPIPNEMESYDLIEDAISDMESTYIAQVPQTLVGTPFESTIDIILDRVP